MPRSGKERSGARGSAPSSVSPGWEGVPTVLEGPGIDGHEVARKDVQLARRLWREGTKARP